MDENTTWLILAFVIAAVIVLALNGEAVMYWLGIKSPPTKRAEGEPTSEPRTQDKGSLVPVALVTIAIIAVGHAIFDYSKGDERDALKRKIEELERKVDDLDSRAARLSDDLDHLRYRVGDLER